MATCQLIVSVLGHTCGLAAARRITVHSRGDFIRFAACEHHSLGFRPSATVDNEPISATAEP